MSRSATKFANALLEGPKPKGFSKFGPGGVRLVFGHDPYTPCMVYMGKWSATFGCAVDTGEVELEQLNAVQMNWLLSYETAADDHITAVRGPDWRG